MLSYPKTHSEKITFREQFLNEDYMYANKATGLSNATVADSIMTCSGGGVDFNVNIDRFFTDGGTIILKFRIDTGVDAFYKRLFIYRLSDDYSINIIMDKVNGYCSTRLINGAGANQYSITWNAFKDAYTTIAIVWDKANTTLSGYERGVFQLSSNTPGAVSTTLDTSSQIIRLGKSSIGADYTLIGYIDNCDVYVGTLLSGAEILDAYQQDTFIETDASQIYVWLRSKIHYLDITQKTANIGSLGGTIQVGDGATSTTFPTITTKGFDYDGTTDYLNLNSIVANFANTTTGTFAALVKTDDYLTTQEIISFGDTDADTRIQFDINTGTLRALVGMAGITQWALDTDNIIFTSGNWIHVAIVQDGVSPILYVNGIGVAQAFSTSTNKTYWFNNLAGLDNGRIGCGNWNNGGNAVFFNGIIKDIVIVNSILTPTQIRCLSDDAFRRLNV